MQLSHIASLTGLFAALCTTPAAAQTFPSLPGQGPLEDKPCQTISGIIRPGNIIGTDQAEAKRIAIQKGWAHIMQNDCKMKPYLIDAQGNATAQDNTAPFRLGAKPPTPAPTPSPAAATIATTSTTGWATIPGLLPAQVDPISIRPIYVPMPSTAAWREEGCIINGIKMPIHAGLILDNRTFWHVSPKCKLLPLVTVTRDTTQPLNGPATRFDSATELLASIDKLMADLAIKNNNPGETAHIMRMLHGGPIIPLPGTPPTSAVQVYPGKAVVVDESLRMSIGMARVFAGHMDDNTALILQAPQPAGTATALTGEWWHQPGLLPTSPQGNITAAGRDAAGNCRVNLNNKPLVAVPAGSIILTDTTRAFAVLADCKVEPLITLPQANTGSGSISVAGGGIRNPGPISPGPNPGIGQAGAVMPIAAGAATLIVSGLAVLGLTPTDLTKAFKLLSTIIIQGKQPDLAEQLLQERLNAPLTDATLGAAGILSMLGPTPTVQELRDIRARSKPQDASEEAERLSDGGPGNCTPDEHQKKQKNIDMLCEPSIKGLYSCPIPTNPFVAIAKARINMACARTREDMNNQCYAGGDSGHRDAIQRALNAAENCLRQTGGLR